MATSNRVPKPRPENPQQNWMNKTADKFDQLVPGGQKGKGGDLLKAAIGLWKARDMSANATARAECFGVKGLKEGATACTKPFDKDRKVARRKFSERDATAFLDRLSIPTPGGERTNKKSNKQLGALTQAGDFLDRLSRKPEKGKPRVAGKKKPESLAEKRPQKKLATVPADKGRVRPKKALRSALPKIPVLPGEDKMMFQHQVAGKSQSFNLGRFITKNQKNPMARATISALRALEPGKSVTILHETFTRAESEEQKAAKREAAKVARKAERVKQKAACDERKAQTKAAKKAAKATKKKAATVEKQAKKAGAAVAKAKTPKAVKKAKQKVSKAKAKEKAVEQEVKKESKPEPKPAAAKKKPAAAKKPAAEPVPPEVAAIMKRQAKKTKAEAQPAAAGVSADKDMIAANALKQALGL